MKNYKRVISMLLAMAVCLVALNICPIVGSAAEPSWIYEFKEAGAWDQWCTVGTPATTIVVDEDNGYTSFYSFSGDSSGGSSVSGQGLDGSSNNIMVVYYRTTEITDVQFYVHGADGSNWGAEGTFIGANYEPNGQWNALYIDMSVMSSWASGEVIDLRFDYACSNGFIDIMFIAAFPDMAAAEAYVATVNAPAEQYPAVALKKYEFRSTESVEAYYRYGKAGDKVVVYKGSAPTADNTVYTYDITADGSGTFMMEGIPGGSLNVGLVRNGNVADSVEIEVEGVVELTEYEKTLRNARILLSTTHYSDEFKALKAAYDAAVAAGKDSDVTALTNALNAYRTYIANNPMQNFKADMYHSEAFSADADLSVWKAEHSYAPDCFAVEGYYQTGWVPGADFIFGEDFYNPVLIEFDMYVQGGACNGFALKGGIKGLYGGGRYCAGDDLGRGLSVDLFAEQKQDAITFGFNNGGNMTNSQLISIPYPEGFSPTAPHNFKIYDCLDYMLIFIDNTLFARLEFFTEDQAFITEASVYGPDGSLAGVASNIELSYEGGFGMFGRAGRTLISNFVVSDLEVVVPEGEVTPSPVPTATPVPTAEPTAEPTAAPGDNGGNEGDNSNTGNDADDKEGSNVGLIVGIIIAVVVIAGVVVALIVIKKKK